MENQPRGKAPLVCLFDSGIGGLNLLRACSVRMPYVNFCYFADNYNVPYGNLCEGEIRRLVFSAFSQIAALCPDAAAVACNTVTAECVHELRRVFPFPVVGVEPAVKQAFEYGGKYLVLATEATCKSAAFFKLLSKYGKGAEVHAMKSLGVRTTEVWAENGLPATVYKDGSGAYTAICWNPTEQAMTFTFRS